MTTAEMLADNIEDEVAAHPRDPRSFRLLELVEWAIEPVQITDGSGGTDTIRRGELTECEQRWLAGDR